MSEPLTPERLAELRRIAEAATPGPLTMHLCDDARYAAFVDAPHLGPDEPELAVFLIERDARFFAEFDRDTVLAMLDEIDRLRREVREWMCDRCNTVYPDPPQPGIWCAQCPRCGGDTAPRGVIERRRLEQEIERLRLEQEEIADNVTRFVLYDPDLNAWECQACRFWWEFEVGDPYEHDMRFCPRCGRWIMREAQQKEVKGDGEAEGGASDA